MRAFRVCISQQKKRLRVFSGHLTSLIWGVVLDFQRLNLLRLELVSLNFNHV